MAQTRVGIFGASGQTGRSIVDGLLEAGNFHLIALARPASVEKPSNKALQAQGIEIRALDVHEPIEKIAALLKDIDILVSAVHALGQLDQIPLATAAKQAGVKRFLPCAAMPVVPAGGIHMLRDFKEEVFNHIKIIGLPYTIVDVGWWYQISFPALPSGKIDYAVPLRNDEIAGDGNQLSALTDLRDIGHYFARILLDERTINKYVLIYNEMWSQNAVFDTLSRLSGEDIPRTYQSRKQLEQMIQAADEKLKVEPESVTFNFQKISGQYRITWGIRGDNTPEYAKFLGYLTSKELYPDMKFIAFEDYLKEVLDGKAKSVYDEYKDLLKALK